MQNVTKKTFQKILTLKRNRCQQTSSNVKFQHLPHIYACSRCNFCCLQDYLDYLTSHRDTKSRTSARWAQINAMYTTREVISIIYAAPFKSPHPLKTRFTHFIFIHPKSRFSCRDGSTNFWSTVVSEKTNKTKTIIMHLHWKFLIWTHCSTDMHLLKGNRQLKSPGSCEEDHVDHLLTEVKVRSSAPRMPPQHSSLPSTSSVFLQQQNTLMLLAQTHWKAPFMFQ